MVGNTHTRTHLKQIEKPKFRVEKRVTLANFRRFVVPEDQDYWLYQDLSAEDIKLSKDTSKYIKQIWKSAFSKIK